jgi:DNA polymerase III alpha subunit
MLLNCHTHFSLKYGILSPRQLLEEAQAKGWKRFVLADINNTSAGLDVLRMAPEYGIEPLLGIDFEMAHSRCLWALHKTMQVGRN